MKIFLYIKYFGDISKQFQYTILLLFCEGI